MDLKKAAVQVRVRYKWDQADASRLRQPVAEHLLPLLTAPTYVRATVGHTADGLDQVERVVEYGSVPDWLEALGQPSPLYHLNMMQGSFNNFDLMIAPGSITVQIRGPVDQETELRARLASFGSAAGLKAIETKPAFVTPPPAPPAIVFRKTGNYRLLEDATKEQIVRAADLIVTWMGEIQSFTGTLATRLDPGVTREIKAIHSWKEVVSTHWAEAENVGINFFRKDRTADLRLQLNDRSMFLNLTAGDDAAIRELSTALADTIAFTSILPSTSVDLRGELRYYYITQPITASWIQSFLGMLKRMAARSTFSGGTFRIAGQDYGGRDLVTWMKEVDLRWSQMQSANCWISASNSRHTFQIDFEREQLKVNLSSAAEGETAVTSFGDFAAELNLEPAPVNPYLYYRFARTYRNSNEWAKGTDQKVAEAIENAIAAAFASRRYLFVSGLVTEGGGAEEQISFDSVASFLERVRDSSREYISARIYLQGPMGYDLNVYLGRRENKVVVRSSIPKAGLFKDVVQPFSDINELELVKSEDRTHPGEDTRKDSRYTPFAPWVNGMVAAVIGGAVSLLVATIPARKNMLEIVAPRDASEIPGRSCRLQWAVVHSTPLGQTSDTPSAHVFVSKEGDPTYRNDMPAATSGILLQFPSDGVYDISVSPPGVEERNTRITVKTPQPVTSAEAKPKAKD